MGHNKIMNAHGPVVPGCIDETQTVQMLIDIQYVSPYLKLNNVEFYNICAYV